MYVLDSDHISILQLQSSPQFQLLTQRIAQHSQAEFYVTIVSFHEQFLGWNSYIARATDQAGIVRGYAKLEGTSPTLHHLSYYRSILPQPTSSRICGSSAYGLPRWICGSHPLLWQTG